ncbi:MAG: hypothetical protein AB7Q29_19505 [Vicinamibacterales bacterium]
MRVSDSAIRLAGLGCTAAYAVLAIWLFTVQPASVAEVTGGLAAGVGVYRIDDTSFEEGLRFFRRDQFIEARAAFARADPAARDATTQFYIAYAYYRQGWGRFYNDDALFAAGLEAVERAASAAGGQVRVDDPDLKLQTSDELRAELERGMTRDASDFNPLRVLGERK